ncbi:hypothetical protein [Pseudobutyrivibrio xylanivorans]|uniref:DUF2768 domain-containing protein n=1 Tax=Pseudobutyrivibrio xylanivorans TaxID=185007 RepID=A0A5P6VN45_PSEXY|nr:hypothetical protein [Pseudobutyrivibrio xylanivorans]QFJ53778.1 hypothetical protein FXF36_02280 [Pseudobutyrivibrio xylanivorans]
MSEFAIMILVFLFFIIILAIGLTIKIKETDNAIIRFLKIIIKIIFIGIGGLFLFVLLRAPLGGWV